MAEEMPIAMVVLDCVAQLWLNTFAKVCIVFHVELEVSEILDAIQ